MNRPILLILNDYFGHGGHVKSFISHLESISTSFTYKIICSKDGYLSKNIDNFDFLNLEDLHFYNFEKMTKSQIDFDFYKLLKKLTSDNYIIHSYSFEAIFMMSLLKLKYKNISTIVSVMGGQNPFPYLSVMDKYIAVSEEQKEDAIKFSDDKNSDNISIIKNRIKTTINSINEIKSDNQSILIVTRFDEDKLASLKKIFELINVISNDQKILIAGNGVLLEEYQEKYSHLKNIEFLGYINNLNSYANKVKVIIGMGRSILEFMLLNKPAILMGYKGIEILNNVEKVEFASKYNFAGRKIYQDNTINETKAYIENMPILNNEDILNFLRKEYDISNYKSKYTSIINDISSKNISYISIIKCYIHIFNIRLKRKIKK